MISPKLRLNALLFATAAAVVPGGLSRQYTEQRVGEPTTLKIHRGANGEYTLYDDDVISLDYLQGNSVQTLIKWDDATKQLSLEPSVVFVDSFLIQGV
jgi:hypothetical protein